MGNSLGLMSKRSKQLIDEEIQVWQEKCVRLLFSPLGVDA